MLIKVMADSGRRIAWTDRKNGYFQFLFSNKNDENGYFRGNTKFLDGFAAGGKKISDSKYTEVFPYGFKAVFEKSFIEAALLLEEQAFYLNSNSDLEILKISPSLLLEETLPLENIEAKSNRDELEKQVKSDSVWSEKKN